MDLFQNQCNDTLNFDSMMSPLSNQEMNLSSNNFSSTSSYYSSQLNGNNDILLPSIFVKIPLQINQQYQSRNNNSEEIKCEEKSESIKSEIGESQSNNQTLEKSNPAPVDDEIEDYNEDSVAYTQAVDADPIICLKCDLCPFLTISQQNLNNHQSKHNQSQPENWNKLQCPGCDNVFYKKNVLELHLVEDHCMTQTECELLLNASNSSDGNQPQNQPNQPKEKSKSRIYIKNVQLLKKPDVIEQENVQQRSNANKSKIFIKNVHTLQNGFSSNENTFQNSSGLHESKYSFVVPSPGLENLSSQSPPIVSDSSSTLSLQRSKIFIKNVDILRNPMASITPPSNSSSNDMNTNNGESMYTPPPPSVESGTTTDNDMLIIPTSHENTSSNNSGKSKIFIKNISVLKQPTIHLKSVDELNLMTFDQLQNLLPANNNDNANTHDNFNQLNNNYSNNNSNSFNSLLNNVEENEEMDDENQQNNANNYEVEYQTLQNCEFQTEIDEITPETIQNEYNNVCIAIATNETNEIESIDHVANHGSQENHVNQMIYDDQKCDEYQQYNGDTNILYNQTDEDILFVCAEEIINLNQQAHPTQNRIYVADNLMEPVAETSVISHINKIEQMKIDAAEGEEEKSKNRGRPKGAKQCGITRLKKLNANVSPSDVGHKCDVLPDCGVRFKNISLLEYHSKCHIVDDTQSGSIKCPECNSLEYKNWNTLHTHLWRDHNIDMELYSCELCNFKTPILSRLNNTHMKIHSEERNFKCEHCDKAFKNTKQLRNHRRLHRQQDLLLQQNKDGPVVLLKKCVKCGLKFTNQRSLKNHMENKHGTNESNEKVEHKCEICGKCVNTKTQLKTHTLKHSDEKRFKCEHCDYSTNDHNAFRRHKMRHNKSEHMYKCCYCNYTSIQSTTYRKHLEKRHADVASNLLYKCSKCPFISISEVKYELHKSKHEADRRMTDGAKPHDDIQMHPDEELDAHQQQHELQDSETFNDNEDDEDRLCESVNSDVMIVEKEFDCLNTAFNCVPSLSETAMPIIPMNQPIIRPAIFANNFSKVDNFYCYPPQFQPKILKLTDRIDATHIYSNINQRSSSYDPTNQQ